MRLIDIAEKFLRLPTDQNIDPQVRLHYRGNVIKNALDVILWMWGDSFVSIATILPVFVSTLTDSPVIIGLIPALSNAGWFIPQLFLAGHVQRLRLKMPFARKTAIMERIPYIFLPISAILLHWISGDIVLVIFIVVIAWRGVASGLSALPWQEVIATVIPPPVRSRFFGVSRVAGRLAGVIGSVISSLILAYFAYPNNYMVSFVIGGCLVWISYLFYSRTVEPIPQLSTKQDIDIQPQGLLKDFSMYKATLLKDKNFVRYLFSRALFQLSGMASAFFAVYGLQRYQLATEQVGIFTGLIFISGTLGFLFFGLIGDRIGPRSTLLIADLLQMIIMGIAFISPSVWSIYLIFFILGFAQSGYIIGELIIVMELGPDSERPIYIGLARTLPGLFLLVSPLIGGVIVNQFGYSAMFLVAFFLALFGFVLLLRVHDT